MRISDWSSDVCSSDLSLPRAQGRKNGADLHGFGLYEAPNYDALIDHPVEIGTPQVVRFRAHGAEHEMVFTGKAARLDLKRIDADTRRICEAQIELFEPARHDDPFLDSTDSNFFRTCIIGAREDRLE